MLAGNAAKPMLFTFKGSVRLNDLSENLDLRVPAAMMEKFIPIRSFWLTVARTFPDGIPITLKGTTAHVEYDLEAAVPAFTQAGLSLITGGGSGVKSSDKPNDDPIGGLIDAFGKKKKKSK